MRLWRMLFALLSIADLAGIGSSASVAATVSTRQVPIAPKLTCATLESLNLQGVPDAPIQIILAKAEPVSGETPAHCRAEGYIASNIRFAVVLPDANWNGKFIEMAPGGQGGSITTMQLWCDDALRRGYACITHDTGHYSTTGDSLWAYGNLSALIDYSIRSSHVAAVAGKAIVTQYYGQAPRYSYFQGCSGGGQKALVEAQRFPWDFDGIISMDPATNLVGTTDITLLWNALAIHDEQGRPRFSAADIELLHGAALALCDADDGVKDGVIGNPRACKFDPAVLACGARAKTRCLSDSQVAAARKIYSGPETSAGKKLFYGAMPGSELGGFSFGAEAAYKENFFRYLAFSPPAGPSWVAKDFNFDEDYKRSGVMSDISAADNPDLKKFRDAGGKLIIISDLDSSGSPLPWASIDYYEMVEKLNGGSASTQQFARLFALPGVAHCGAGAGANAFDLLSYMEAWVEHDQAPTMMVGAHIEAPLVDKEGRQTADFIRLPADPTKAKFTRPAYPYPLRYHYKGSGNPDDYRNFAPLGPDPTGEAVQ